MSDRFSIFLWTSISRVLCKYSLGLILLTGFTSFSLALLKKINAHVFFNFFSLNECQILFIKRNKILLPLGLANLACWAKEPFGVHRRSTLDQDYFGKISKIITCYFFFFFLRIGNDKYIRKIQSKGHKWRPSDDLQWEEAVVTKGIRVVRLIVYTHQETV